MLFPEIEFTATVCDLAFTMVAKEKSRVGGTRTETCPKETTEKGTGRSGRRTGDTNQHSTIP